MVWLMVIVVSEVMVLWFGFVKFCLGSSIGPDPLSVLPDPSVVVLWVVFLLTMPFFVAWGEFHCAREIQQMSCRFSQYMAFESA
jgi:hypothetical protein